MTDVVEKYLPWCRKMAGLPDYRQLDPSDLLSVAMVSVWQAHLMAEPGTKPITLARKIFRNAATDLLRKWYRRRRVEAEWPTYDSFGCTKLVNFCDISEPEPWQVASAEEEVAILSRRGLKAKPCVVCGTLYGAYRGNHNRPCRTRGMCESCYGRQRYLRSLNK